MPLREDILKPIPGENPGGQNLRYCAGLRQNQGGPPRGRRTSQGAWQYERKLADYALVIKLTEDALATQSKDLQLAAWLTEALLKKNGFGGFNEGLQICSGLVGDSGTTSTPNSTKATSELRAAPLEWVGNKLDVPLKSNPLCRDGYELLPIQRIADGRLRRRRQDKGTKGRPREDAQRGQARARTLR